MQISIIVICSPSTSKNYGLLLNPSEESIHYIYRCDPSWSKSRSVRACNACDAMKRSSSRFRKGCLAAIALIMYHWSLMLIKTADWMSQQLWACLRQMTASAMIYLYNNDWISSASHTFAVLEANRPQARMLKKATCDLKEYEVESRPSLGSHDSGPDQWLCIPQEAL